MKIKSYIKGLTLAFGMFNFLPASAQVVIQANSATLQPLISRDSTGFSSCGVRAVVIDVGQDSMDGHDFSLSVYADAAMGLLKSGKSRLSKGKKSLK